MIPMVDLHPQYESLKDEILAGFRETLDRCAFIMGPNVTAFEQEAAGYLGVQHAVACASGTDALHLALRVAGVEAGDEVITTPFTFIATAEAIRYIGARPVFVDIDTHTFNIDPALVEAAVTGRTKVVLPVHLFGQPANLDALQAVADRHALKIVEDCAQSFGATYGGRQTGSIGAAAGFSFFPSKNLGAYGDGGLLTTNDGVAAKLAKMLRNHGSEVRYHHDVVGYNSRLDELQAVVLRAKLKHIDRYNAERRRVAQRYTAALANVVVTPHEDPHSVHVYHQYTVLSDRRDAIAQALQAQQIASAIYYPIPLHRQPAFADACAEQCLPVSEAVAACCLSLPIYPELSDAAVDQICAVIRGALA